MTKKTGIIILAAGSSSRLGQPKQLLEFEGQTLLRRISTEAVAFSGGPVQLILGSHNETIGATVQDLDIGLSINLNWQTGMSSSIRTGLQDLLTKHPDLERCIICLCDQPFVDRGVFQQLQQLADSSGKGIVACSFDHTLGAPVLFDKKYFNALSALQGSQGAKNIIAQYPSDCTAFPFEAAAYDIDSEADYFRLPHQLVSVEQAQRIISYFSPASNMLQLPISEALGYTLSEAVVAAQAIPNFAQSSMDGYAIRYNDRDLELPVTDKIPAGSTQQKQLDIGTAMRIYTGAPLPLGADTVVMQEKVQLTENGSIKIKDSELRTGDHVRPKGSETDAGSMAMMPGTYLSPAAIGYLAGVGCTHVHVFAPPRVTVILTGDELRPLGSPLGFGEVYESNSYQLRAALSQLGIREVNVKHVLDDKPQLQQAMEAALAQTDVVLLVGGVSVGDYDYVVDVAKSCGVTQRFHRIRQKPGKPLFFGTKDEKLVFGLPGNPSSALTCFYLYVVPALERIMQLPPRNRLIKTVAAFPYSKKPGLTHFLKASYDGHAVTPLHAQESYRLQSYAQANCLLILNEDSSGCAPGDEVFIHLFT